MKKQKCESCKSIADFSVQFGNTKASYCAKCAVVILYGALATAEDEKIKLPPVTVSHL